MACPDGMRLSAFRAGLWKPRTRPGTFEGVGEKGLPWLQEVQRSGLPVAVEVATPAHLEAVLGAGVRIVWIGSRTTTDPFAVQSLADALSGVADVQVFVKNPINPDPDLWIGAMERVLKAGVSRVCAVHRGFSFYERSRYRNAPKWQVPIDVMRRLPDVAMFCDPSHIAGDASLVAEVAQSALDLGFAGLFVESHIDPSSALSDSAQQLTPAALGDVLAGLVPKNSAVGDASIAAQIDSLRSHIDEVDDALLDLLASRMRISEEIGRCKKKGGITVLQSSRWEKVLEKVSAGALQRGLDPVFARNLFNLIHEASIERQK